MDHAQIVNFFDAAVWVISKMSVQDKIRWVVFILGFFSTIHMMIIGPIIFNCFILKNIQKRLGVMFSYDDLYRQLPFSFWMMPELDASFYITAHWILKIFKIKIKLNTAQEIGVFKRYFLRRVGFTIDMATKFEIFMSLSIVFCGAYVCIIAPIIWNLA